MTDVEATRFTLRVEAGPEAPASCRLFVAATLRTIGADEATIDDAKLAVSELVTTAVQTPGTDAVEISIGQGQLDVLVTPLEAGSLDEVTQLIVSSLFTTSEQADGVALGPPDHDT